MDFRDPELSPGQKVLIQAVLDDMNKSLQEIYAHKKAKADMQKVMDWNIHKANLPEHTVVHVGLPESEGLDFEGAGYAW